MLSNRGGRVLFCIELNGWVMGQQVSDHTSEELELRHAYHLRIAPIFEKILVNIKETHTLATTRDALLPELISGELRLKCAMTFL